MAVELNPRSGIAHVNLGHMFCARGQSAEGIAAFRTAIELEPAKARISIILLGIYAHVQRMPPRHRAGCPIGKLAVELESDSPDFWNTLGIAFYRAGQLARPRCLHKSYELRDGGNSFDYFFLAMADWQLGHQDEAREWYAKAVEWMDANLPNHAELIRFRAEAEQTLAMSQDVGTGDHPPPPPLAEPKTTDL